MKDTIKKLSVLFNRKQKIKIVILLFMILLGGLLETLGVSLLTSFASMVADQEAFLKNDLVVWVCDFLNIADGKTFIAVLLGGLIAIYIGKNIYLIYLSYVQSRFIQRSRYDLSRRLLWHFLHKPYEYYLYADSASLLRTLFKDVEGIFFLAQQYLSLISEVIIAVCLVIFLSFVDFPMVCMMVVLLLAVTFFSTKFIKPRQTRVGEESRVELSNVYKWILQSVSGIKEVKIMQKQNEFTEQYSGAAGKYAYWQIKNSIMISIPRSLIESIAIGGVLLYTLIRLLAGTPVSAMVPGLMAFAGAAMRLLPAVSRINTHIFYIKQFFFSQGNNL